MLLTYLNPFFVLSGAKKKDAQGFSFDKSLNAYITPLIQVAAPLRKYGDESAKRIISKYFIIKKPWRGSVTYPKGKTPKGFQFKAVKWVLKRNRSYIAADPGLGKSVIMALIINSLNSKTKNFFIIICPPSLAINLLCIMEDWLTNGEIIQIYEKGKSIDADILIIKDSILTKKETKSVLKIFAYFESVILIDEAHHFKNAGSARTRALLGRGGIVSQFEKVSFFSGTPMPNGRPMELWPVLCRCAPQTIGFMNRFDFGMTYCGGYRDEDTGHYVFDGASNLKDFSESVKKDFMLRLKKSECLPELKGKHESVIFISKDLPPKAAALERKILAENSPKDLFKGIAENEHISTYRRLLGELKAPLVAEWVRDRLDYNGEPIIIFAIHKEVIKILKKNLDIYNPLILDGSVTSKKKRQEIADEFQNNKIQKLLIGNIRVLGEGYTLTRCKEVGFCEWGWSPGENEQAGDRVYRIGQDSEVFMRYFVFKNSLDRSVLEKNLLKRGNINKL